MISRISLYHKTMMSRISLYHSFVYIPTRYHGFSKISWYQGPWSCMISYLWYHSFIWYHIWYHGFLVVFRVPRSLELYDIMYIKSYYDIRFLWYHIWYHKYLPLYHYMIYKYDINENNDIIKTWYHTFIWNHTMISYVI